MKISKRIIIISIVVAVLVLVAGLNRPVLSPFDAKITFTDLGAISRNDAGVVAADSQNKRLLFASPDYKVHHVVELTRAGSPFAKVTDIVMNGDLVYVAGKDTFNNGNFISDEKIVVYDLNGKYLDTVYEEYYDDSSYITTPRIKDIVFKGDALHMVYEEDLTVSLISFGTDNTPALIGSWDLDESLYHAFYSPVSDIITGISRSQHFYLVNVSVDSVDIMTPEEYFSSAVSPYGIDTSEFFFSYKTSSDQTISDQTVSDRSITCRTFSYTNAGDTPAFLSMVNLDGTRARIYDYKAATHTELTMFSVGALLRIYGALHYLAIIWLAVVIIAALIYVFAKKKLDNHSLITIGIILLVLVTAVFYTIATYHQVKDSYSGAALSTTKVVARAMRLPLMDNEAIATEGAHAYCTSEESREVIDKCQEELEYICTATGTGTSLYSLVYINDNGTLYSFLDSSRIICSGIPIAKTDELPEIFGAEPDTIIYESTSLYDSYLTYSYVYDDDGNILGAVVTGFYADCLLKKQTDLALNMFINLSTILIVLYLLLSTLGTFKHDIKRRRSRAKDDFDNRSADIAGIYVFIKSISCSMDSVILVFVARSLCADMDPVKAAAMAAIPLTAGSIGRWLGTFFANPLSNKFGEKKLSYFSSICGIGSMLLCIFSIQVSSIYIFSLGKLLSGIMYQGIMYVIGDTIPFNSDNAETRVAAQASTKTAGYAAGIISTLMGGYISQYLSYSVIYLLGAACTVPLIFMTPMLFSNKVAAATGEVKSVSEYQVKSWRFWITRDMIMYVIFFMLPSTVMSGYNSYLLPLYTSAAGVSELLLSNLSVYSRTFTYMLTDTIWKVINTFSHTRMMIISEMSIAFCLVVFIISPNVYWALIAMFIMSIFTQAATNVGTLFIGDAAIAHGYNAKTEVSNYFTVFSAIGCGKSSILSAFISLGMNAACVTLGIASGAFISVYAVYLKFRKKIC